MAFHFSLPIFSSFERPRPQLPMFLIYFQIILPRVFPGTLGHNFQTPYLALLPFVTSILIVIGLISAITNTLPGNTTFNFPSENSNLKSQLSNTVNKIFVLVSVISQLMIHHGRNTALISIDS